MSRNEPFDPRDPDPPQYRTVILTVRVRATIATSYDLDDLYLDAGEEALDACFRVMVQGPDRPFPATMRGLIDVETIDASWEV